MMQKAIIYGCGNLGKFAYEFLKNQYKILFFVDKNAEKIAKYGGGVSIYKPQKLLEYPNIKIILASVYQYDEMLENIKNMGIMNPDIMIFRINFKTILSNETKTALDNRVINLGAWLLRQQALNLKDLTFISGGSGVLDYLFLKQIAIISGCKEYLEVGTYIGESINILTDCCEKLYSVTLPKDSLKEYFIRSKNPDYTERLSDNAKITHYYMDSKLFDYSKHADTVDLYFIDGDHSYQGVYHDTKNIFTCKKRDAIVIWHDFKLSMNEYRDEVIQAVQDALGRDFDNVYVTDNNLCGIYVPQNRLKEFDFLIYERKYRENAPLYTYNVHLNANLKEV